MERVAFSVQLPKKIAGEMRAAAARYSSGREVWVPTAAAALMFLAATPDEQREAVLRVRRMEIEGAVEEAVAEARSHQAYRTGLAEAAKQPVKSRAGKRDKAGGTPGAE